MSHGFLIFRQEYILLSGIQHICCSIVDFLTNDQRMFSWQVHRRGWVGHWSWGKLLAELVVKFGVLGIVTHLLDAYWQFVLPLAGGRNYNEDVYRQVGGGKMKPA